MKAKLERYLRWLREGFLQMLRLHPVESALTVYACAGCLLTYELDWDHSLPKLALAALFFAVALVVNNLAGRGPWRRVYWVSWTPIVPLSLWGGLEAWIVSEPAFLTFGILVPLALLMCRRAVHNERFVCDALLWLRSGVLAVFFANVALGLFGAILFSTTYIFGLEGAWIDHVWTYALIVFETFAVPVLFLMMADRWREAGYESNRILEILLNYIVAPALLIYTAILYLYMAKILVTWSLPEGGVAYLVFGFTLFALAVKALGRLLEKRIYDWFFDRFSLVSLPVLALFWIGVVRRTNEYGLTEPRVYLVVCGGLMTLCVLLFLSQRTGRYLWVCLAAWVSFAALAYVSFLEPERIAVQSQTQRAERVAERLGRLGGDGRLLLTPMPLADTVYKKEYRKLYESLDYIRRDSAAFARFGVKDLDDLAAIFPEAMRDYVRWGYDWSCVDTCVDTNIIELEAPVNVRFEVNAEYPHYYTNLRNWYNDHSYDVSNDTLRLFLGEECAVYRISCRDLLERQLERSGFDPAEACEPAPEQLLRLLDYRDDRCRILFENIKLERTDSAVVIQGMAINAVLMR